MNGELSGEHRQVYFSVFGLHMARLAKADEIGQVVRLYRRSKEAKGLNMMHAQLFPYFALGFTAYPTLVIIALSRLYSSLLPLMVDAAFLCKWPRVIIPMFSRVACIIPSQPFRYFQAYLFTSLSAFVRRAMFLSAQLLGATARASCSLMSVASLHIKGLTTIRTLFLNLCAIALPGTKSGVASGPINVKGFAASLAGTFNLFQKRQTPALTRTIGLRFLSWVWNKITIAAGARFGIHSSIITQTVWQW